ncbi:MAG: SocA family protein [Holosporales bacterium]|nr:SocA family protein [Holosporales bacterium]
MRVITKGIRFNVDQGKALETIVYISNKVKHGISHYHVMKTIFFADKEHLNKYGRPIIGDRYIKMPHGPVPSTVYDIIKMDTEWLEPGIFDKAREALEIIQEIDKPKIRLIFSKRDANPDWFSESDLECLDSSFDFCKDKTFEELEEISHKESAWKRAKDKKTMDYALMLDDDNPMKNGIIEDLKETSIFMIF